MTASVLLPDLRAELLQRSQDDQYARFAYLDTVDNGGNADWAPVQAVDDDNLTFLITVIDRHGWPGSDLVAEDGAHAAWLLVQHAPPTYQDSWLPLMQHAVKTGKASARDLVYLQDRVNMHHNRRQTHGSQSCGMSDGNVRLWPVTDPANLNARRAEVDLPPLDEATIAAAWTSDELQARGRELVEDRGSGR